jgi:hypothetical protein
MLQDSLRHAHSLTWIMVERYARGDHAPLNDTLDLLFDLLDVAFRTVEWWEPEEEGQP